MKERPILFQGAMVRALLAGTKTQTRRAVKLPHMNPLGQWEPMTVGGPNGGRTAAGETIPLQDSIWHTRTGDSLLCPYGQPGDRLWVKETWRTAKSLDADSPSAIATKCLDAGYSTPWAPLAYEADGHRNGLWRGFELRGDGEPGKTRVSIHMPRWASRITLEITGVRVERLQEISEADAAAEGIEREVRDPGLGRGGRPGWRWAENQYAGSAVHGYELLWESINGAGSWDANPWVWVVEFRRVKP